MQYLANRLVSRRVPIELRRLLPTREVRRNPLSRLDTLEPRGEEGESRRLGVEDRGSESLRDGEDVEEVVLGVGGLAREKEVRGWSRRRDEEELSSRGPRRSSPSWTS